MNDVNKTLNERGTRYGDFTHHANICQGIKRWMMDQKGWHRLNDVQRQALDVIADKIARILSGDPNYADNWHDIQGYAKLVEDRLPKTEVVHVAMGANATVSVGEQNGCSKLPPKTTSGLVGGTGDVTKSDFTTKPSRLLDEAELADAPEELRAVLKMLEQSGAKLIHIGRMR